MAGPRVGGGRLGGSGTSGEDMRQYFRHTGGKDRMGHVHRPGNNLRKLAPFQKVAETVYVMFKISLLQGDLKEVNIVILL